MGRVTAIGDIHGTLRKLEGLIEQIGPTNMVSYRRDRYSMRGSSKLKKGGFMKKVFLMCCLVLLAGLFLTAKPAPLHASPPAEQQGKQNQWNTQSAEQQKKNEKAKKEELIRRYERIRRDEESKRFDEAIERSKTAGKHEEVRKYEEAKRKWESKNVKKTAEDKDEARKYAKTAKKNLSPGTARKP